MSTRHLGGLRISHIHFWISLRGNLDQKQKILSNLIGTVREHTIVSLTRIYIYIFPTTSTGHLGGLRISHIHFWISLWGNLDQKQKILSNLIGTVREHTTASLTRIYIYIFPTTSTGHLGGLRISHIHFWISLRGNLDQKQKI